MKMSCTQHETSGFGSLAVNFALRAKTEVAGGEQDQQEDQGFTGLFGYPGGKSEQHARHFGAATSPELIPGHWIWAMSYTKE